MSKLVYQGGVEHELRHLVCIRILVFRNKFGFTSVVTLDFYRISKKNSLELIELSIISKGSLVL